MKCYLLDVGCLAAEAKEDGAFLGQCFPLLDMHRKEKCANKKGLALAQGIGAGLLLQLAARDVQERDLAPAAALADACKAGRAADEQADACKAGRAADAQAQAAIAFVHLSVPEVLNVLSFGEKIEITYAYSEKGKPKAQEPAFFFSLSHSENLVCLVVDKRPVGVDLQAAKPVQAGKIAKRFFAKEEEKLIEDYIRLEKTLGADEARAADAVTTSATEAFYRLWVKKESYGKFLGEGFLPVAGLVVDQLTNVVFIEKELIQENKNGLDAAAKVPYYLAICLAKQP